MLQRPDFKLLTWTAEDVAAYTEEARTLGAPLEAPLEAGCTVRLRLLATWLLADIAADPSVSSQSHVTENE